MVSPLLTRLAVPRVSLSLRARVSVTHHGPHVTPCPVRVMALHVQNLEGTQVRLAKADLPRDTVDSTY